MNLNYTILWFDDQPHNLRSTEEGIKQRLNRLGFTLKIKWVKKVGDLLGQVKGLRKKEDEYDLVLMDWNLGSSGPDGAVVAGRIRTALRYTDMVFYSSAPKGELRNAIADQGVDGVYCVERKDLVEETDTIVHRTIRRIVDVNHMRGLVMGAVAEFDHTISDCIRALYNTMPENEKMNLVNKIIGKLQSAAKSKLKKAEEQRNSGFDTLMEYHDFSSSQRYDSLKSLLKAKELEMDLGKLLEILDRYSDEVLEPRNILAHARAERKGKKVHFQGDGLILDEREMSKLRRNLIDHETNIHDLLKLIKRSTEEE